MYQCDLCEYEINYLNSDVSNEHFVTLTVVRNFRLG